MKIAFEALVLHRTQLIALIIDSMEMFIFKYSFDNVDFELIQT